MFFGRIRYFMIRCLALLLHTCFGLFMGHDFFEISYGSSNCFSLFKVIAFTCSMGFVSVLHGNDPWGLFESKFTIWPTWASRFQMESTWFLKEVSVFIINCDVFNASWVRASSKLIFFSWGWKFWGFKTLLLLLPAKLWWFIQDRDCKCWSADYVVAFKNSTQSWLARKMKQRGCQLDKQH